MPLDNTAVRIDPDRKGLFDLIRPFYKQIDSVKHCMQCGTCSGGCPTAFMMEQTPRALIYMINLGLTEQVLQSRTIWQCVNCYTCSVRCPRDIKVSEVFDALRTIALAKGYVPKDEQVYHHAFTRTMERHGRVFEVELMMRYALKRDPLKLLRESGFGMSMMSKGRMHLTPHKVKGLSELKARFHKD